MDYFLANVCTVQWSFSRFFFYIFKEVHRVEWGEWRAIRSICPMKHVPWVPVLNRKWIISLPIFAQWSFSRFYIFFYIFYCRMGKAESNPLNMSHETCPLSPRFVTENGLFPCQYLHSGRFQDFIYFFS